MLKLRCCPGVECLGEDGVIWKSEIEYKTTNSASDSLNYMAMVFYDNVRVQHYLYR